MTKNKNNFGSYLYSERIRRGVQNLTQYLNDSQLSISETYYRDLEAGRRLPRIETAKELCDALKLNTDEFFYFLLKDMLPAETFERLIKPSRKAVFDDTSKEIDRLATDVEMLRKAYSKRLVLETYQVDDQITEYLDRNFSVLPLIHFIYMRQSCSYEDIKEIMTRNKISKSLDAILNDFESLQLAVIDRANKTIRRHKRAFRIPRTSRGIDFKDRFFLHEAKLAVADKTRNLPTATTPMKMIDGTTTYLLSTIICVQLRQQGNSIADRITDLLASIEAEESDLETEGTVPFFLSVVVSPRHSYDVKNERHH